MVLSSIFSSDNQRGGNQAGSGQTGGGSDIATLIIKNKGFLAKIFTNLIVQLAITYYVMENYPVPENKWLYIFGSFGLLLVIAWTNLPYWAKFFVFVMFSYVLGRLSAVYKKKYSEEVIRNGILGAMGVFAIMFVVGALVPVLGDRFGMWLFFALLALLIARIVSLFTTRATLLLHPWTTIWILSIWFKML